MERFFFTSIPPYTAHSFEFFDIASNKPIWCAVIGDPSYFVQNNIEDWLIKNIPTAARKGMVIAFRNEIDALRFKLIWG